MSLHRDISDAFIGMYASVTPPEPNAYVLFFSLGFDLARDIQYHNFHSPSVLPHSPFGLAASVGTPCL